MPKCNCGFDFVRARLEGPEFKSYAVISNDEYKEVIAQETRIMNMRNGPARLHSIAQGAAHVGTLCVCPECGSLSLSLPTYEESDAPH